MFHLCELVFALCRAHHDESVPWALEGRWVCGHRWVARLVGQRVFCLLCRVNADFGVLEVVELVKAASLIPQERVQMDRRAIVNVSFSEAVEEIVKVTSFVLRVLWSEGTGEQVMWALPLHVLVDFRKFLSSLVRSVHLGQMFPAMEECFRSVC